MSLLTPFLIGLFSSVHCLAMCGGLCAVFCRNNPRPKTIFLINLGRITTYTILGALFAGIVQGLAIQLPLAQVGFWIRSFLGVVLIFLGIRVLFNKSNLRSFFEKNTLWQKAKVQLHKITRLDSVLAHISKGLIWGLIPCGLLYGVLLAAAATHNFYQGGFFMLAFGLGTLPSMFVAAGLIQSFEKKLHSKSLRYSAGLFIIIIGLWSLLSPWFSHELIPKHPVFTSLVAFLDSCTP